MLNAAFNLNVIVGHFLDFQRFAINAHDFLAELDFQKAILIIHNAHVILDFDMVRCDEDFIRAANFQGQVQPMRNFFF